MFACYLPDREIYGTLFLSPQFFCERFVNCELKKWKRRSLIQASAYYLYHPLDLKSILFCDSLTTADINRQFLPFPHIRSKDSRQHGLHINTEGLSKAV